MRPVEISYNVTTEAQRSTGNNVFPLIYDWRNSAHSLHRHAALGSNASSDNQRLVIMRKLESVEAETNRMAHQARVLCAAV
jgi:hypothetical protein